MPKALNPILGFLDEGVLAPATSALAFRANDAGSLATTTRTMQVYGLSDFIDEVIGTAQGEAILAHGGDDKVNAGQGDDLVDGGAGRDFINGGEGHDDLHGGLGIDTLQGGEGDDVIDGGAGVDSVAGGLGNDLYRVFGEADLIDERTGEGHDTVITDRTTFTLQANVEDLIAARGRSLTAVNYTGNEGHNLLVGGYGNDTLSGGAGRDQLDGRQGADRMVGGKDDDVYSVDNAGDIVVEQAGEGRDSVVSTLDWVLGDHVEALTLRNADGTMEHGMKGTGNALDNTLLGSVGSDLLRGLDGKDLLGGGAGNDTMEGGSGDDTYLVDDAGDKTLEVAGGGTDLVRTSLATHQLQGEVEHLEFFVSIGANGQPTSPVRFHGIGNDGANRITGWSLQDTLEGGAGNDTLDGGQGADDMTGGQGNDQYIVDHVGDVIHETSAPGGGNDTVLLKAASHTLAENVENVYVHSGQAAYVVGNKLGNVIVGDSGKDSLAGLEGQDTILGMGGDDLIDGGAGADLMYGNAGNDTYTVDDAGDKVVEQAGEGFDTVLVANTGMAYTLTAEVENLRFVAGGNHVGYGNDGANDIRGASGADTLNGGFGKDTVDGGDGDDVLMGAFGNDWVIGGKGDDWLSGGQGADSLVGGDGADRFVFSSVDLGSQDRIIDFTAGIDEIDLSGIDGRADVAGDQALWFRGSADFIGGGQGSVRLDVSGADRVVLVDANGDGAADLSIALTGAPTPGLFDFVL